MKLTLQHPTHGMLDLHVGYLTQLVGQRLTQDIAQLFVWHFEKSSFSEVDLEPYEQEEPLFLLDGEVVSKKITNFYDLRELSQLRHHFSLNRDTILQQYLTQSLDDIYTQSVVDKVNEELMRVARLFPNFEVEDAMFGLETKRLTLKDILLKQMSVRFTKSLDFIQSAELLKTLLLWLACTVEKPTFVLCSDTYLSKDGYTNLCKELCQNINPHLHIIFVNRQELSLEPQLVEFIHICDDAVIHLEEYESLYVFTQKFTQCSEDEFRQLLADALPHFYTEYGQWLKGYLDVQ